MTAPRDPAAGATPAREETLDEAIDVLAYRVIAFAHHQATSAEIGQRKEAVKATALRERDAAREDAARLLREFGDHYPNLAQLLDGWHQDGTAWSAWDEQVREELREYAVRVSTFIDAARAAAEGRTP